MLHSAVARLQRGCFLTKILHATVGKGSIAAHVCYHSSDVADRDSLLQGRLREAGPNLYAAGKQGSLGFA